MIDETIMPFGFAQQQENYRQFTDSMNLQRKQFEQQLQQPPIFLSTTKTIPFAQLEPHPCEICAKDLHNSVPERIFLDDYEAVYACTECTKAIQWKPSRWEILITFLKEWFR